MYKVPNEVIEITTSITNTQSYKLACQNVSSPNIELGLGIQSFHRPISLYGFSDANWVGYPTTPHVIVSLLEPIAPLDVQRNNQSTEAEYLWPSMRLS